jgi:hypothetical protein
MSTPRRTTIVPPEGERGPANDNADSTARPDGVRAVTPANDNRGLASTPADLDGMIRDLARLAADLYFEGKLDRQGAEPVR